MVEVRCGQPRVCASFRDRRFGPTYQSSPNAIRRCLYSPVALCGSTEVYQLNSIPGDRVGNEFTLINARAKLDRSFCGTHIAPQVILKLTTTDAKA